VPKIDVLYQRWLDDGRNLATMTMRAIKLLGADQLLTGILAA
jgi:hypothetical protein